MSNLLYTESIIDGGKAKFPYTTEYSVIMNKIKSQKLNEGLVLKGWRYEGKICPENFYNEFSNPFGPITKDTKIYAVWEGVKITLYCEWDEIKYEGGVKYITYWAKAGNERITTDVNLSFIDEGSTMVYEDNGTGYMKEYIFNEIDVAKNKENVKKILNVRIEYKGVTKDFVIEQQEVQRETKWETVVKCKDKDKCEVDIEFESFDGGDNWISTGIEKVVKIIEHNSPECGYVPEPIYSWREVEGEYICQGTTKYRKLRKWVSYDDGSSWQVVVPYEDTQGSVIEYYSTDCGYVPTTYYRWVNVDGEYICEDYNKYKKQKKQWSYDEINWHDTDPLVTQKGDLIEEHSEDCGWTPIEPLYDWREVVGDWMCQGTTKCKRLRKWVSYDNGSTWNVVTPYEDIEGEVIEYQSTDCGYSPEPEPTQKNYLQFTASDEGTFKFTNAVQYSLDDGTTWITLAANTNSPTVSAYSKILWKATLTPRSDRGVGTFSSTGRFAVSGNPMSLLWGDDFEDKTDLTGKDYAFQKLFSGSKVTSARGIDLVATTLSENCYSEMFSQCDGLTTIPSKLPATTLAPYCYREMFGYCVSLTKAPELPASTLADACYTWMFYGCTKLTTAPELPATTLTPYCYQYMFDYCESLTTAPELPATTLADYCYYAMFDHCTSLTTAPELPATTLKNYCYDHMFSDCTLLKESPVLPAKTLVRDCYNSMFQNCNSLKKITCLAYSPDISYTMGWVQGVPTGESVGGVFIQEMHANWPQCQSGSESSGIPCGWTVQYYNG